MADGGKTWKLVTRWEQDRGKPEYAHADHHALLMPVGKPGRVYDMHGRNSRQGALRESMFSQKGCVLQVATFQAPWAATAVLERLAPWRSVGRASKL